MCYFFYWKATVFFFKWYFIINMLVIKSRKCSIFSCSGIINVFNPCPIDCRQTHRTRFARGKINSDDYNLFDFGLSAGLKANLTPNVNVYARYVFGLTNVFNIKYPNQVEVSYPILEPLDNDMKNSNLMFGLGFSF